MTFPFMTSYDPPGTSEGTLDPLGLYQIADQLAVQLVPAVRERMQRIRFLTAMAVGALVTEGLEDDPSKRDASPYLVWEWLVVEALIREMDDDPGIWGVPGTLVTRRALSNHDYLDARSYLKNPRIFGFNGVYKRLAMHLGIVNVHMGPGPNAEGLVNAWASDLDLGGISGAKSTLQRWTEGVRRSMGEKSPRTRTGWNDTTWAEMAGAFAPATCKTREKRFLRNLILLVDDRRIGALPAIWKLNAEFDDKTFREERLHSRLDEVEPGYGPILNAIRSYEAFARSLQDAFDVLRVEALGINAQGHDIAGIISNDSFRKCSEGLHEQFTKAHQALGSIAVTSVALQNLFSERFDAFAEPMGGDKLVHALCSHHESVQRAKSSDGKRAWFDRIGQERIYIRQAYRKSGHEISPGQYVHSYRGWPIRRFYRDLL